MEGASTDAFLGELRSHIQGEWTRLLAAALVTRSIGHDFRSL